ncbi:wax ester/triacylglycerol synthase family O-acyltransferase [Seongchinamella sediminis]|uniref:diacylglycerol O-acyltransferase n=1 Tax=Seongchinamella sediminis TaxID=2283635 RepID=A0A3L7DZN7_9GAMM|nr:wax ester/triacylglycerol synthase family O-acyltransferase [Seongchinamella sediminis]RLQ22714.1 wax ester/triacylglycerol synthase family O-acyltransferase [Seongchinamella sediminis]
MSATTLKPLDAIWLMLESDETPMHVGVLATFRKPAGAGTRFYADMAREMRAAEVVAPWNLRLDKGPLARLAADPGFDIDYHFRRSALAQPGGERELGRMISRLHSHPLDRRRPLWEFHLIEGLEGDRFAFYIKLHHALVDAVNGVPMLLSALASSARARRTPPLWAQPIASGSDGDLVEEYRLPDLAQAVDALGAVGKVAAGMLQSALRPSERNSFLFPRGTPKSTLNRRINSQRRFATQQFAVARCTALAEATGSTVNEILTYLCGSTLRRFFKEYNALPDSSLIGMMPVSLQERGEHIAGNAIAGIRVPLGTDVGDPLARLAAVKESMKKVRADRASLPAEAVTPYVMMRAAPLYASQLGALGRWIPPQFNLVVSNTHGADKALYFNGAKLEAVYPLSQLMQFSALSIDCVSYAGTFNIGFTGARDTLPHLQRMAVYFGKAVDELEERVAQAEVAQ